MGKWERGRRPWKLWQPYCRTGRAGKLYTLLCNFVCFRAVAHVFRRDHAGSRSCSVVHDNRATPPRKILRRSRDRIQRWARPSRPHPGGARRSRHDGGTCLQGSGNKYPRKPPVVHATHESLHLCMHKDCILWATLRPTGRGRGARGVRVMYHGGAGGKVTRKRIQLSTLSERRYRTVAYIFSYLC